MLVSEGLEISASTVEGFARKLSKLGLLERTLMERTTQQLERLRSERRRQRQPLFRGELFRMRFSFGDPDGCSSAVVPAIRWCFTPGFRRALRHLFAAYLVILGARRESFTDVSPRTHSPTSPWSRRRCCCSPRS